MRAIFQVQAPRGGGGGLYLEGRLNGGFFALLAWGAYTWRSLFSEFYDIFCQMELGRMTVPQLFLLWTIKGMTKKTFLFVEKNNVQRHEPTEDIFPPGVFVPL